MHATIAAERSQLNYTKSTKWKLKRKVIPKKLQSMELLWYFNEIKFVSGASTIHIFKAWRLWLLPTGNDRKPRMETLTDMRVAIIFTWYSEVYKIQLS